MDRSCLHYYAYCIRAISGLKTSLNSITDRQPFLCQSIKQVNCLYGNQLAGLPASADSAMIIFSAHSFLMLRVLLSHQIAGDGKDQVRVSVRRHMMNPSFLNSTPLTCHSATEVALITKPNTITKLSPSALCVCLCV